MIRRFMTFIVVASISLTSLSYAQLSPMEAIEKYNVILVHGAADSSSGVDCSSSEILDAWTIYNNHKHDNTSKSPWKVGGSPNMLGSYSNNKKVTNWLNRVVFEDADTAGSKYIYLQRSFMNPADARELGDPTWQGENYCVERRSLIEEAQEVKVGGRENLKDLRTSKNYFNIPSRNILIGYSMGGVASSEYVRGTSI